MKSILARQQNRRHAPIMFGDDVDRTTSRGVTTQQACSIRERIFIGLLVIGAEFVSPVATMMAVEEFY